MSIGRRCALGLLSVRVTASQAVCAGKTPYGSTDWKAYGGNLYVNVNTSACSFQEAPVYVTSLVGDTNHWLSKGSSEVYLPEATGFRIYILYAATPAATNGRGWHVHWLADSPEIPRQESDVCSGRTAPGSTDWQAYDSSTIYVDVDTSACNFKDAPVYVTSLAGQKHHWSTTGSSEVYHPTATAFRIYITKKGVTITPAYANAREWHVNWMADRFGSARPAGGVCSGRTKPGSTDWVQSAADCRELYVDVNTSACGFQDAPVHVTSLAGQDTHRFTTGGSEVYWLPSGAGFRIYVHHSYDSVTPDLANSYEWHINWMARSTYEETSSTMVSTVTTSSSSRSWTTTTSTVNTLTWSSGTFPTAAVAVAPEVCTHTSGATESSQYPCACGGSLCEKGQLCLAALDLCETCPASYELTSAGCQCPLARASVGGGPCLQVLAHALKNVADPKITSAPKAVNGHNSLLKLELDALPSGFFEAVHLAYAIDVAPSLQTLDVQSNCTHEWKVGPVEATLELTHSGLDGPCTLTLSQSRGKLLRQGVVGVYIKSMDPNSGKEHVEWMRWLGVSLEFDASVVGMFSVYVDTNTHSGDWTLTDVGEFPSAITLYQSYNFRDELPAPYALALGDPVHVQQRLDQPSPDLSLEVETVYLASLQGAGDSSAVVRNVTDEIQQHVAGSSETRFTFVASGCNLCVLHVISLVKLSARRLGDGSGELLPITDSKPHYTKQSIYVGSVEERSEINSVKRTFLATLLLPLAAALPWLLS